MSLKPQAEGVCDDYLKANWHKRKDDTEEIAKSRFETYFKRNSSIDWILWEKRLIEKIDANGDVPEVWERLLDVVK